MKLNLKRLMYLGAAVAITLLLPVQAEAQLNGSHSLGDFGVNSGTQPQPGFYTGLFYLNYDSDTIKDRHGNTVAPLDGSGDLAISAIAPVVWYVNKATFLGGHLGFFAVIPWANASIEAPAVSFGSTVSTSFADTLVRPLDLGWHNARADTAAGLEIYLPTGRYERGGDDNIGKGMWTYEPFIGTTIYLDQKRTFSVATTAYWEFHSKKKDTDTKVGQILTLEGGAGKSFLGGGVITGAAYYAQWKVTEDQLGDLELPGGGQLTLNFPGKHKVFAFGPDVTLPVASKSKLFALVNIRYLWETGAQLKTQGQTLVVSTTIPIPSVKLK